MKNVNTDRGGIVSNTGLVFKFGFAAIGGIVKGANEVADMTRGTEFGQLVDSDSAMDLVKGEGKAQDYVIEKTVSVYNGEKSVKLSADEVKVCNELALQEWKANKDLNLHALRLKFKQEAKIAKSTNQ